MLQIKLNNEIKSSAICGAFCFLLLFSNNCFSASNSKPKEFPNPLKKIFLKRIHTKSTAAVLAFPFPFGCVGLHRAYLGTAPYVPIVYAATGGGIFGLLPLIDFFNIIASKNIEDFEDNPHVIMWISHKQKTQLVNQDSTITH